MKIQFKKLRDGFKVPTRDEGNAYYDLYVPLNIMIAGGGEPTKIPLGFSCKLPAGHHAEIVMRSSTYKNWGVVLANQVGIIDCTYCGDEDEWCLLVRRTMKSRDWILTIPAGTRLAQFTVVKDCDEIEFEEVETLGTKNRGGFGSTGK